MAGTSNFETEEELHNTKIIDAESLIEKLGNICYSLEVISCQDDIITIKQYFGSASRTSRSSSSMPLEDLEQLTQQIRDQLEESITEKVTRKMMESFSQMQSQFQSQMQSQGIALPPEPEVGPSGPRVSTKESCVAPSGNNPGMGDSDKCGLYIEENPSRLVALGRLYEGSTTVHN